MRISKNDLLIWICCRQTLQTYAKMASNLQDRSEFNRFREAMIAELQAILPGSKEQMELWSQATSAMVNEIKDESSAGVAAYALDRLGLWPKKTTSTPNPPAR